MNLNLRKKEIETRLNEIKNLVSNEGDINKLEEYEKETDTLQEERKLIDKKMALSLKTTIPVETNNNNIDLEKRGNDLKEARAIKVASEEILLPEHVDTNLKPYPFQEYSNLVDKVSLVNLNGGETYTKAYVKGHGEAGFTNEGEAYKETEPTFDYLQISKVKVTCYTEITEELEKLPAIQYQNEVIKNINISLKKTLANQILNGDGSANRFIGIFSSKAKALEDNVDLEISEIDNNTLEDIIYAYGGDEAVEGSAVLILSKLDLRAFAKLTKANGEKLHTIDYKNQTIDGIAYIISSNCEAISNTATLEGKYGIAYGALTNYEVPVFSPIEIVKSSDYKFKEGITCYKASVFTGGNVVGYKGFVRVKKKAPAAQTSATTGE